MYNNSINSYINGTNITGNDLKDLSAVEMLEAFQKKIDKSDLKNSYTRYSTELDLLNKAVSELRSKGYLKQAEELEIKRQQVVKALNDLGYETEEDIYGNIKEINKNKDFSDSFVYPFYNAGNIQKANVSAHTYTPEYRDKIITEITERGNEEYLPQILAMKEDELDKFIETYTTLQKIDAENSANVSNSIKTALNNKHYELFIRALTKISDILKDSEESKEQPFCSYADSMSELKPEEYEICINLLEKYKNIELSNKFELISNAGFIGAESLKELINIIDKYNMAENSDIFKGITTLALIDFSAVYKIGENYNILKNYINAKTMVNDFDMLFETINYTDNTMKSIPEEDKKLFETDFSLNMENQEYQYSTITKSLDKSVQFISNKDNVKSYNQREKELSDKYGQIEEYNITALQTIKNGWSDELFEQILNNSDSHNEIKKLSKLQSSEIEKYLEITQKYKPLIEKYNGEVITDCILYAVNNNFNGNEIAKTFDLIENLGLDNWETAVNYINLDNLSLVKKYDFKSKSEKILNSNQIKTAPNALQQMREILNDTEKSLSEPIIYNKLNEQLTEYSLKDIEEVITEVQKSGITRAEAIYALQMLTQFGSVKSLEKAFKTSGLNKEINSFVSQKDMISANNALEYFCGNKKQISLQGDKKGFILDENGLKYLKSLKPEEKNKFINNPDILFINFEGWDNGINLYTQGINNGQIVDKAKKLIAEAKEIQKNKNIPFEEAVNQVLNKPVINRANMLGIKDIKPVSLTEKNRGYDINSIYENLKPIKIDKKEIDTVINAICETVYPEDKEKSMRAKVLLAEYFNNELNVFSPKRYSEKLTDLYNAIESKIKKLKKSDGSSFSMEDVYYIIPSGKLKSYDQIAYQYSKLKGIDTDKFIYTDASKITDYPDDKIYVALDDVIGSGESMVREEIKYNKTDMENIGNRHIIFASLISGQTGADKIKNYISTLDRLNKDFLITDNKLIQPPLKQTQFYKDLSPEDKKILEEVFSAFEGNSSYSFGDCAYAILLPYMGPDNNAVITSFLFKNLLLNSQGGLKAKYKKDNPKTEEVLKRLQN